MPSELRNHLTPAASRYNICSTMTNKQFILEGVALTVAIVFCLAMVTLCNLLAGY